METFVCDGCKRAWCYRYLCTCGSFCYACAPCHAEGETLPAFGAPCRVCNAPVEWEHADGPCGVLGTK